MILSHQSITMPIAGTKLTLIIWADSQERVYFLLNLWRNTTGGNGTGHRLSPPQRMLNSSILYWTIAYNHAFIVQLIKISPHAGEKNERPNGGYIQAEWWCRRDIPRVTTLGTRCDCECLSYYQTVTRGWYSNIDRESWCSETLGSLFVFWPYSFIQVLTHRISEFLPRWRSHRPPEGHRIRDGDVRNVRLSCSKN